MSLKLPGEVRIWGYKDDGSSILYTKKAVHSIMIVSYVVGLLVGWVTMAMGWWLIWCK